MIDIINKIGSDMFLALLGGGCVALINAGVKFIRNKKLEYRFPVSGKYISHFEDVQKGQKVIITAPAEIKQKGNVIKGKTISHNNRVWTLEGTISSNGHIHGIYTSDDPIDKAIGNFFLNVDKERNMTGLWSGFDSDNNRIDSGKYIFKHINEDIEIIDLERKHIPHVVKISDKEFGLDYLKEELINQCLYDKETHICKVAIDKTQKNVLGFCISLVIEPKEINQIIHFKNNTIPRTFKFLDKIGILKTIAVKNEFKGSGIGTKLMKESINTIYSKGVYSICSPAWKSINGTNLKGVLERIGFEEILEIKDYWKEESIANNYVCPVCGSPPCKCSSVIYYIDHSIE